ncbi:MAG: hypothetical protein ACOH5I_11490 [Oligoflexus sp.]
MQINWQMRWTWWLLLLLGWSATTAMAETDPDCLNGRQRQGLQALLLEDTIMGPSRVAPGQFLSPGEILMDWYAGRPLPIVIREADDLKFLPFTLPASNVVLVIDRFPLSDRQVDRVLAVADTLQITLHLLWLGDSHSLPAQARQLALATQGQVRTMHSLLTRPDCAELRL